MRKSFAILVLLALSFSRLANAAPQGVYDYQGSNKFSSSIASNPNVDGVVVTVHWSDLQPTSPYTGVWSVIDNAKVAGKNWILLLSAGVWTPSWVGGQKFSFIWNQNYINPYCANVSVPVPWDQTYLNAYTAALSAITARYHGDPTLVGIKLAGIQGTTAEVMLPRSAANTPINNGQCFSNDDAANWAAAGYSAANIESAFATIQSSLDAAHKPIIAQFVSCGFPLDAQCSMTGALMAQGYADPNFASMNDGWSQTWAMAGTDGAQEVGSLGTGLAQAISVLPSQIKWVEIYDADLVNPANAATLANLHSMLN